MRSFYRVALAGALTLTLGVRSASADTQQYFLNMLNIPGTGPFVEITVNRTSTTTATITFDGLSSGTTHYLLHSQGGGVQTIGTAKEQSRNKFPIS